VPTRRPRSRLSTAPSASSPFDRERLGDEGRDYRRHGTTSLFAALNPPERALVLCADEKAQIQALECTQPNTGAHALCEGWERELERMVAAGFSSAKVYATDLGNTNSAARSMRSRIGERSFKLSAVLCDQEERAMTHALSVELGRGVSLPVRRCADHVDHAMPWEVAPGTADYIHVQPP
jgi:hypothetical protein